MTNPSLSAVASAVALAMLLSGCAAPRGPGGASAGGADSDNCGTWLVVGAIGGLLAQSGKSKGGKAAGALTGAAAAYALCKAISSAKYSVQQTKSEQQAREEYVRASGRAVPAAPTVTSHGLSVNQARGRDPKGASVTFVNVRSDISVVSGAPGSTRVEEQVVLMAPDGRTKLGDIRKTAGTSAGGYGAVTQITMPDGLEDGQYEIRHMVLLDGAAKSERIARFSYVAGSPAGSQVLALLGDSPLRN
jgi:hypothetical protein